MGKIDKIKRDNFNNRDNKIIEKLFQTYFHEFKIELPEDEHSHIDMCATARTNSQIATYDIEIKSRKKDKSAYTDCVLEHIKYDALMSNEFTNERKIYAVIYPKNNIVLIWNVGKIDSIKQYNDTILMPDISCINEPILINKCVYKLPFKLADEFYIDCAKLN